MKLIVGLGNPGEEYAETRHNLGYMTLDGLSNKLGVNLKSDRKLKAEIYVTLKDETLILAKPETFMNLSGQSVAKIASYYKIQPKDIWVVSDDLDLEFGTIRIRQGGSSGGHNGLKDIIEKIGEDFVRFRVGIKNKELPTKPTEKFVLEKFNKAEKDELEEIVNKVINLILESLKEGIKPTSTKK